jgi:transcription initiation factor IIE alpha subunit
VQAGKSYKMFISPQGTVYASQKKAVLAGFKVSMA